jgi:hypothetical protein
MAKDAAEIIVQLWFLKFNFKKSLVTVLGRISNGFHNCSNTCPLTDISNRYFIN